MAELNPSEITQARSNGILKQQIGLSDHGRIESA